VCNITAAQCAGHGGLGDQHCTPKVIGIVIDHSTHQQAAFGLVINPGHDGGQSHLGQNIQRYACDPQFIMNSGWIEKLWKMPKTPYQTDDDTCQYGIPFLLQAGQGEPTPTELFTQRSTYHGDEKENGQPIPLLFDECKGRNAPAHESIDTNCDQG